jgi:hypothetical protein
MAFADHGIYFSIAEAASAVDHRGAVVEGYVI